MVGHYARFIDGEAWSDVQHQLATAGVKPVAADRTLLDFNIGASVSLAEKTKADQEVLAGERKAEEKAGEESFFGSILNQRDQEIKQLIIKRDALRPKRKLLERQAAQEAAALEEGDE